MHVSRRTLATLTLALLLLMVASAVVAQNANAPSAATAPTASTAAPAASADTPASAPSGDSHATSDDIHRDFNTLLRQSPPELGTILSLDPTLLSEPSFLSRYPDLSRFVTQHPEVRHNPRFYLQEFQPPQHRTELAEMADSFGVFCVFALVALALSWLVRTIIEQKRWNRLSRTQSEVHNKILDRFGTTAELLEYIRTPSGAKFLESAPIPLHTEQSSQRPLPRVLWSVQIGVILAAAAIGLLLVSARFADDTGRGLFAMGMIALCIGIGFVASAAVSMFLSRRLGLWPAPAGEAAAEEQG